MTHKHERVEVLVIGAGPGGAAAATRLAAAGHDVLLVDRAQFPRDKTCGDGLTPRCVGALEQLGALEAVLAAGAEKIAGVRLVGPYSESVRLDFPEFLSVPYGLMLERHTLDDVLRQHALKAGARYLDNIKVTGFTRDGDRIAAAHGVQNGDAISIRPEVVVLATGANNSLLRHLGLMKKMPTTVLAARAYYDGLIDPEPLFDFYFPDYLLPGYGWIFPIRGGKANVGVGRWPGSWGKLFSSGASLPRQLDRFVGDVSTTNESSGWQQLGAPKGYPIRTDFPSHRIAGENWLIVGEAAGLVNPATGEGIDLAIESGMLAADLLNRSLKKGRWRGGAYQSRLWLEFMPIFWGVRVYALLIINPILLDYTFWQMSQHHFLSKTTMKLAMGMTPPWTALHPLFLLQYFLPLPTPF